VPDAIISQIIPIFQEEAWNQQCKVFSDDIDGKLDHLGFNPLKEWLLRRLKALNDKLKKQNQGHALLESIRKYQNILWTLPYLANLSCCSNFVYSYAFL
jgi:hypothetical protein